MLTLLSQTTSMAQFKFSYRVGFPCKSCCDSAAAAAAADSTGAVRGAVITETQRKRSTHKQNIIHIITLLSNGF